MDVLRIDDRSSPVFKDMPGMTSPTSACANLNGTNRDLKGAMACLSRRSFDLICTGSYKRTWTKRETHQDLSDWQVSRADRVDRLPCPYALSARKPCVGTTREEHPCQRPSQALHHDFASFQKEVGAQTS